MKRGLHCGSCEHSLGPHLLCSAQEAGSHSQEWVGGLQGACSQAFTLLNLRWGN